MKPRPTQRSIELFQKRGFHDRPLRVGASTKEVIDCGNKLKCVRRTERASD